VVIRPPGRHDAVAARIDAAADRVLAIPGSLQAAQSVIAEARLDVLLYTDIGMEPLTYFLGFARLAPVQCVTWGHPDTTGIPAIDYYLSCAPFEPADAASHYAERLIRLPGILMDYRPPAPPGAADRADFGLDPARPLLLCPQNVFKLHPDFDGWLAAILRHAPDVQLALMEGQKPGWTARLRRRLAAAAPDVADRIRMVPVQPTARFFQLLTAADAILDPTHFGGGNTTFHALSLGLPIVTARGRFMRDRFVQGTYALLGIDGPVVDGSAAYAAAAADLSREPDRRAALSRAILAAAPALTDGSRPLRALERFLEAATDAARRGDLVADRAW
jgi:protein O-GlcNAc transferase